MERTDRIVLPDLRYPFAPAISDHAESAHEGTVGWARGFGLLPEEHAYRLFEATGIGRLAARTHPTAAPEDLRLISDWYAWLFFRDDVGDATEASERPDELSAADGRSLAVLEGAKPAGTDGPLVHALADLKGRLREYLRANHLSEVWMRRFVRAVRTHLEATLWEAANRSRGAVPDLPSYVRMRPLTGGLFIVTELTEIIEGVHLPREMREHRAVRRLSEASHNVACWANDLLSLEKELGLKEVNNLVVVLQKEYCLGLQAAADRAGEMHDAEVRAFVASEAHLPSLTPAVDANLARYAESLRHRMRGILDWSRETERYRAGRRSEAPSESTLEVDLTTPSRRR